MERLTDKKEADAQRKAYEKRLKNGYPRNVMEERFLKLAAYEDTGLSPETVSDLLERFSYFYRTVEGLDIVDPVHFGAFVDRVKRWQQAEKDGRLVVLPCKVCDTVYIIRDQKIITATVESIHQWCSGKWKLNAHTDKRYTHWVGYEICLDEFGKTVFLTREEAEAALKKREGEDNETD